MEDEIFVRETEPTMLPVPDGTGEKLGRCPVCGEAIYAGEQVILARKQVVVNSAAFNDLIRGYQVDGLVDIMRFNFSRFLRHMDNPVKKIFLPDGNGGITTANAKRVYHVNIIVRYGMKGQSDSYIRFRIVLSRNGIKRINIFPVVTRESGKSRRT